MPKPGQFQANQDGWSPWWDAQRPSVILYSWNLQGEQAGAVAGSALSSLPGSFNLDQEGPLKSWRQVCKFPRAAIINYHKLGGSRQHKFIFWRPEALNQGVSGATFPPKAPEQDHFLSYSNC